MEDGCLIEGDKANFMQNFGAALVFVQPGELKQHFRSADYVDGFVVFNISGNKYRLIAAIHFDRKKVYIRHILTHQEYDREKWKRG